MDGSPWKTQIGTVTQIRESFLKDKNPVQNTITVEEKNPSLDGWKRVRGTD